MPDGELPRCPVNEIDQQWRPDNTLGITRASAPQLWSIVEDVCTRVGTRVPDHIVLHALSTFYVMQGHARTMEKEIRGRILAVGAPLVRTLTIRELQAVLAHFSGRDTLYSSVNSRVCSGLGAARPRCGGCRCSVGRLGGESERVVESPSLTVLRQMCEHFA